MGLFYLTDGYAKLEKVGIIVCSVTLLGAVTIIPYCVITTHNDTQKALEELNTKIEKDLDVDSFSTQSVIFDKTNENFLIKITGSSKDNSYLAANYKVNEQDYYNLQSEKNNVVKINEHGLGFIKNVLEVLNRSEFLEKDAEELALVRNGELVLNLSKPYVDEEKKSINYDLTIARLHGSDLKLGKFVVSAPLTDTLKENPKEVYSLPSEKVEIEKVKVKTYTDVAHVEMYDNSTLII